MRHRTYMSERLFDEHPLTSCRLQLPLPCIALGVTLEHLSLTPAPAILVVTYAVANRSKPRRGSELSYPHEHELDRGSQSRGPDITLKRLISTETRMFGLTVRFDLVPGRGKDFDRLVETTLEGIRSDEPGTLLYLCHRVEGMPDARVFYELYRDHAAFEEHENKPHVKRFLNERTQFLARSPRVDRLSSLAGKGMELH